MTETGDSRAPNCNRSAAHLPHGDAPVLRDAVDLDVSWLVAPELTVVDVLARVQVITRHRGRSLWLHGATSELVKLLDLDLDRRWEKDCCR